MKKLVFDARKLKNGSVRLIGICRRIWKGYGYYISLACLLMLFGVTAYMYRTGRDENDIILPPHDRTEASVMAMVQATSEPEPTPTPYSPEFIIPVAGEIITEFSDDEFSWNETLGQWQMHYGIDIAADSGTAVFASEDGTVGAVFNDELLGNVIEIVHEDGWVTRYCCVETIQLVESGMNVMKGDIISSIGNSSISEMSIGPHIHFEILKDGKAVAPSFE